MATDLRLGDGVIYRGRPCVINGFSPMGVEPRSVWLRDILTNSMLEAPLSAVTLARPAIDPDRAA